jgi:hypothetical protein
MSIAPGGVPVWFDHDSVNRITAADRRFCIDARAGST